MHVSKATHLKYLERTFDDETYLKLAELLIELITKELQYYGMFGVTQIIVYTLCDLFFTLSDDKLMKSYVYQVMVSNGLVDDMLNNERSFCRVAYDCKIPCISLSSNGHSGSFDMDRCYDLELCPLLLHVKNHFNIASIKELPDGVVANFDTGYYEATKDQIKRLRAKPESNDERVLKFQFYPMRLKN